MSDEYDERICPVSERPPFFIVGNDRSGTTLLRLVLDRNAEVAIPTESMFLMDIADQRTLVDGVGLDDACRAKAFLDQVWNHPKVRLWGLPAMPPELPTGLAHEQAYRFIVEAPYRAFATSQGKTRWGDKTPSYLKHVEELIQIWPQARFLLVVRDGRDVTLSVRHLPFGANNVWASAVDWSRGIRLGLDARDRHPQNVEIVHYEQFVKDSKREVERICEFLDLVFDPAMLQVSETRPEKLESDKGEWFMNIWNGINSRSVERWRAEMSTADQRLFVAIAGDELRASGYSADQRAGTAPRRWRKRGYWLGDRILRLVNFVRLRIVQERGRELKYVIKRKWRRR